MCFSFREKSKHAQLHLCYDLPKQELQIEISYMEGTATRVTGDYSSNGEN